MPTDTPLVTIQTVSEALRAVRFAKSLGHCHPISDLFHLSDKRFIYQYVDEDVYADTYVYHHLTRLMRLQLNRQRSYHDLGEISQDATLVEALRNLTNDFQQSDTILEAWSILYHLHGRSDLGFSVKKITPYTAQTVRTLQRRQKFGTELFTRYLLKYELHIRSKFGLINLDPSSI